MKLLYFDINNLRFFREDSEVDDPRIRLVSWNIDGLDQKNLRSRTLGVADKINR